MKTKSKAPRNRIKREQSIDLAFWAMEHKKEIQDSLNNGKDIAHYAHEKGVNTVALSRIFAHVGIVVSRKHMTKPLLGHLLVVLARVAKQSGVSYEEIKPYLNE